MWKTISAVSILSLQCVGIVAIAAQAEPLRITISYEPDAVYVPVEIDPVQHACLTEAIYWEGRNQEIEGKIAIGNAILNRVASPDFPDTVCGVVHQGPLDGSPITRHRSQFSYFCDGLSDAPPTENILERQAWDWADVVAEGLLAGDIEDNTFGSTYYHADYVDPSWNDVYAHNITVGAHLFYTHSW